MLNSTANTPNLKPCSKGDHCKHPQGPNLPESEFYAHRGGLAPHCKECHKTQTSKYKPHAYDVTVNRSEARVVEKLRSLGIYSVTGKSSEFRWADVVAWGCVRIEVKSATLNKANVFSFSMGYKKRTVEQHSDLVVLVVIDDPITYHVFPSSHAIFYHEDGSPKRGLTYMRDDQRKNKPRNPINDALMNEYLDKWELIEQCRLDMILLFSNSTR